MQKMHWKKWALLSVKILFYSYVILAMIVVGLFIYVGFDGGWIPSIVQKIIHMLFHCG